MQSVEKNTNVSFDPYRIRKDFPVLSQKVHGNPLTYLDSAATAQKPEAVVETIRRFYAEEYSSVHRSVHKMSELATNAFEAVRGKVQQFIAAPSENEIVFVRGATEGINLVAQTYGRKNVGAGDEVLISAMEHHSNIVPWQLLCEEKGAMLKVIPMNDRGELLMDEFERLLGPKTRIVALVHVSNSLGTINPIEKVIELAHKRNVPVLIDGAQAAPHMPIDVGKLDCDFYTFSGHKMFGPNGIGALFGKSEHLKSMPPYQGGGDMIQSVTFEKTTYREPPQRFEAGTPNIAATIGLGATIDYLQTVGMENAAAHEKAVLDYGTQELQKIPGLKLIGTAEKKAAVLSFTLEGAHPHDIGTILDQDGIAIRAGHHCTQPVMDFFGVAATARASLAMYNTKEDIDVLVKGLAKVIEVFR